MTLIVMEHRTSWDQHTRCFFMNILTSMRLISGFCDKIVEFFAQHFVTRVTQKSKMTVLHENRTLFKTFPHALEAVDVTFQERNRPSGNMQEGKLYFSVKHKLYGYKIEVAVRPNGLAFSCSRHYSGSVSDINIMSRRMKKHQERLEKTEDEEEFDDDYLLHEKYPIIGRCWMTRDTKELRSSYDASYFIRSRLEVC